MTYWRHFGGDGGAQRSDHPTTAQAESARGLLSLHSLSQAPQCPPSAQVCQHPPSQWGFTAPSPLVSPGDPLTTWSGWV